MFEFGITPELAALYKAQAATEEPVMCTNDPDLFFPPVGAGSHEIRAAREACSGCPIVAQCAEYAIMNEPYHGIWGGLSVKERLAIRRLRGLAEPSRVA